LWFWLIFSILSYSFSFFHVLSKYFFILLPHSSFFYIISPSVSFPPSISFLIFPLFRLQWVLLSISF
jgi:hypothetical protein